MESVLKEFKKSNIKLAHFDVMDGHFVPNLSYGADFLKHIKKHSSIMMDVHLMIENLDILLPQFFLSNVSTISVHPEATKHIYKILQLIKSKNIKSGIALNPGTPISVLDPLEDILDHVLVMSVNPGFGGQNFIKSSIKKIELLRKKFGNKITIAVDGGINLETIKSVFNAGADQFVVGSAFFNGDPIQSQSEIFNGFIND